MIFRRATHMAWRMIDDETVVLDIRSNRALWLNRSASRIWQALEHEGSATDLMNRLTSESHIDDYAAVEKFLHELRSAGLATCDDDATLSVTPFPSHASPADGEEPAIVWIEQLERFAGLCGRTTSDIGIPDCMASPNLS